MLRGGEARPRVDDRPPGLITLLKTARPYYTAPQEDQYGKTSD